MRKSTRSASTDRVQRAKLAVPPGTLLLIILKTLEREGPLHLLGISRAVAEVSGQGFLVNVGTIHPLLERLTGRRMLSCEWKQSLSNRRAKYYALTRSGRSRLRSAVGQWCRVRDTVDRFVALCVFLSVTGGL